MDDPVRKAESKNYQGNIYFELKQYANAVYLYTNAIELCPQIAKYYGNRSACYLMMNEYVKALSDARKSTELDKGFRKGYIRIAKCCLATGDIKYAEKYLTIAKGIFIDDKDILIIYDNVICIKDNLNQYELKIEQKKYREAFEAIEKCIEKSPNCIKFIINKCKCLIYLQQLKEAEILADNILQNKSTDEDALFIKATVKIYQENNDDKAFQLSKELKRKLPDHTGVIQLFRKTSMIQKLRQEINTALKQQDYVCAYELLTKAIKIDDSIKITNERLYKQKIEIASKHKKLLWNGTEDCTDYLQIFGINIEILKTRAHYYMELEEFEDAIEDYKLIAQFDNSNTIIKKKEQAENMFEDQLKCNYKILKLKIPASKIEIKNASLELMKRYHPDKNPKATGEKKKLLEKKLIRVRNAQLNLLKKL